MKNENYPISNTNDETNAREKELSPRCSIFMPDETIQKNHFFSQLDAETETDENAPYFSAFDAARFTQHETFSLAFAEKPSFQTWLRHGALFFLTFITTTIAGLLPPLNQSISFPEYSLSFGNRLDDVFPLTVFYSTILRAIYLAIAANPQILWSGAAFSASLLLILTAHEFGHYIACRIYGVDATLPFFIPTPPLIGPAGTLGAFIQIRSPLPSRKATFDIGVAGPIAGFIALLPIALIGLATMKTAAPEIISDFTFSDPLLTILLGKLFGINPANGVMNPFYAASWVGLLVTGLNLIPVGQLDGGHTTFSVFGEAAHRWIGRIAFVLMALTAVTGFIFYNSPSGFVFVILLGFMLRIKHPSPMDETPLDGKRKIIAFLTLLIFILSFSPFPIRVNL